ncbi:MAG: hypothetical protein E7244_05840 [Enterocloster citroniae]|nr:hypothetical protein [Enterocloster citroniae]
MKQAAFDYPYLYFFVGTLNGQSETDKAENILIKLNVNTGGLEQFENADGSLPGLTQICLIRIFIIIPPTSYSFPLS